MKDKLRRLTPESKFQIIMPFYLHLSRKAIDGIKKLAEAICKKDNRFISLFSSVTFSVVILSFRLWPSTMAKLRLVVYQRPVKILTSCLSLSPVLSRSV